VFAQNKSFSEEIAKRIKTKNKDILIIFGGPHCFKTELGEVLLHNNPDVDAVCCLEGEKALPRILEMAVKEGRIGPFPGIASRGEDGRVLSCEDADLIEDLDSLPFADYSDFDMLEYGFKELPISISRGCIYRCSFCSESRIWKKYRFRSAENIFKEIEFQLTRYPFIKSFFFSGSLINGNIEALSGLADLLIDKKVSISWGGQASLRKEMDEAFISRMRRAGLSHVSYGLESASPAILERMSKAFTVEAAERIIRQTKGAGIRTDVNIVVGYPGETEDDIAMTADFLSRNRRFIDEIYYHPLVIMRGSYLYMHKDELGIRFDNEFNPNDWYSTNEENTLEKRLETVAFFKRHIGRKGRSFFTSAQYQQFIKERTSIRRTP